MNILSLSAAGCRPLHQAGGVQQLAAEIQPLLSDLVAVEAVQIIREKFRDLDSVGPVWAAKMVEADGGDFTFVQRDAFERVNAVLDALKN